MPQNASQRGPQHAKLSRQMITAGRIVEYLTELIRRAFTGTVTIHFHQGLVGKITKTEKIDL